MIGTRYFATYFDNHYLSRALALYNSLTRCGIQFHLFALGMDEEVVRTLDALALDRLTGISLASLENYKPSLAETRSTRSKIEYYYTCGPSYLQYVLDHFPEVGLLTYLDSDLYFFASPESIFDEMRASSVGIVEHRFSPRQEHLNRFGRFNVGWVSFRRDADGLRCLEWWADRCLEWCYDRAEENRFADQKYLDEFAKRFNSVHVVRHKGANVAPWNLDTYPLTERDGRLWIGSDPLIFFHFHGFKVLNRWLFDTNLGTYGCRPSEMIRNRIFSPYIRELRKVHKCADPLRGAREVDRNRSRKNGVALRAVRSLAHVASGALHRAYLFDWDHEYSYD